MPGLPAGFYSTADKHNLTIDEPPVAVTTARRLQALFEPCRNRRLQGPGSQPMPLGVCADDDATLASDSMGTIPSCAAGFAMNGHHCSYEMFVETMGAPAGWFESLCPVTCGTCGAPTPSADDDARVASAQAELLPDGSLYLRVTSGGSGYATATPPAADLTGTWAARAGSAAPTLSVRVGSGGSVEAIEVGCEISGARPDNGGTGCLRTVGFGLAAAWEYTQGRLAFETNYSLAATVQDLNGTWREWSEPALFTTLAHGAAAATAAVPPACQEGGVLLTATSGTISFGLERSVSSSDCWWKLAPEGLPEGTQHRVLLHFEPHPDHPDTPISVGERIFSPVPAANVRVALGVAGIVDETQMGHNPRDGDFGGYNREGAGFGNTRMMSFENIRCHDPQLECYDPASFMSEGGGTGVTNGVSKVVVVAAGTGCTQGDYDVVFEPALGSEAKVRVEYDGTVEAILYWPGSGHTNVPSATVDVDGCDGVELRAVINGHPHPNPHPKPNPNHSPSPSASANPTLTRSRAADDWAAGHGLHLRAHGHHWGRRRERAGDSGRHPERGHGEPRVSAERDRDGDHLLDHARDGRGLHERAGDCAVGRRAGLPHHVRGPHGRGAQPQAAHGHAECGAPARPALLRRGAAHPWRDTPGALRLDQCPLPGVCHWVHPHPQYSCTCNMPLQHAHAT